MMIYATVFFAAIMIGIVAGLLPGIGTAMVVIAAYPILSRYDITVVFFFFVVLMSTMQYYGSISSIVFGILGEATSAPAVDNGHPLFLLGHGYKALASTATSSFIASTIGIFVFWVSAKYSAILITLLSGKVKIAILLMVLTILSALSESLIFSLFMAVAGLIAGSAGSEIVTWSYLVFPKYSMFAGGIPFAALLTGFIVAPALVEYMNNKSAMSGPIVMPSISAKERLRYLFNLDFLPSMLRGSILGSIAGAIPGVSFTVSSNLAEAVEKMVNKKQDTVDAKFMNICSAEAANNAGAIVALAPLMLFAIPILPSEALILSIAEAKGFTYATGLSYMTEYLLAIIALLISINVVNWFLSGYCYKIVSDLYVYMDKFGYIGALVICVALTLFSGYQDNQLLLNIYVLVASTIAGFIIRYRSVKMVFIFAFFLSDDLLQEIYRQYLVYFL